MPLYEYECETCGKRFERIQKFSDPPVAECPTCGGPVKKLVSSPAIQFKGSGWYITDYSQKGKAGSESSSASSTTDSKTSGSDATTTSKPDTAGAAKPTVSD